MPTSSRHASQLVEARILDAALRVIRDVGIDGATLDRVARVAGRSRVTLHRRGIGRSEILEAVATRVATEFEGAILPALSAPGTAAERFDALWTALFGTADRHLQFLAGLFAGAESPFHRHVGNTQNSQIATDDRFVAPIERLLRDGALDGSLVAQNNPHDAATVMFNATMWTYVHLRLAHRWPRDRATSAARDVLDGLARCPR